MPPQGINLDNVPLPSQPGTWGVCSGSGTVADIIRRATESWAGHAVMYIGQGQIVQARWPKVVQSAAPTSNVMWATGQPLTISQRMDIVSAAQHLIGSGYDIWAYPALAAAVFYASVTNNVSHLFGNDKWWDCSGLVAECDQSAGVPMFPATVSPHLITPSMLMTLGTEKGWFQGL